MNASYRKTEAYRAGRQAARIESAQERGWTVENTSYGTPFWVRCNKCGHRLQLRQVSWQAAHEIKHMLAEKAATPAPEAPATRPPILTKADAAHYDMTEEDARTHNRLVDEHRIAETAAELGIQNGWLGLDQVKEAGQGAGPGDIIVPRTGRLRGVPLRVLGFGGRKMTMAMIPGYGLGPAGRINFLVCETFYHAGMNTGIRINLPIDER